jgi:hypothetical protein
MLERPYGVVVRQDAPGSSLWRYILAAREKSKEPARTRRYEKRAAAAETCVAPTALGRSYSRFPSVDTLG